nr:MAG TPA: hypothetical protein [Caudoviricetes sp.]
MATVPTATPGKACSSHSLIFFSFQQHICCCSSQHTHPNKH